LTTRPIPTFPVSGALLHLPARRFNDIIPGAARSGRCGHSKLARARTGLLQTSVQFISVTEVVTKSVMKKRNEIFLAKASEIWTRVRRRYLTSFAGLHFENEPGLTELYAAEGRRNRRLCVSKKGQRQKHYGDVIVISAVQNRKVNSKQIECIVR